MTHKEKIIATAYTGIMFIDGKDLKELYEYEAEKLGYGVVDIMHSSQKFTNDLREAVKEDFIEMLQNDD